MTSRRIDEVYFDLFRVYAASFIENTSDAGKIKVKHITYW